MSHIRSAAIVIFAVLIMSGTAAGQRRTRPKSKPSPPPRAQTVPSSTKRPVTINLIQGGEVKGRFIEANTETVQVEVQNGRLTIKLDEVASLIFAADETETKTANEEPDPSPVTPDPTLPAARRAFAALRKLAEAAQIKLPSPQYGSLLIEVRPVVEEAAASMPDGTLRNDVLRALEAYSDAGRAGGAAQPNGTIPISTEPGATLMRKYAIKPGLNRLAQPDHLPLDTTLDTIWAVARIYLNNIAAFLR